MSAPDTSSNLPPSDPPILLASSPPSATSPAHSSTSSSVASLITDATDPGPHSKKARLAPKYRQRPYNSSVIRQSNFNRSLTANSGNSARLLDEYVETANRFEIQTEFLELKFINIKGNRPTMSLVARQRLHPAELFVGVTCLRASESSAFTLFNSKSGCILPQEDPNSPISVLTFASRDLNRYGFPNFPWSQHAIPTIDEYDIPYEVDSIQDFSVPNAIRIMLPAPDDGTGVRRAYTMIGILENQVPPGHSLVFLKGDPYHWENRDLSSNWFNWIPNYRFTFMMSNMDRAMRSAYMEDCYHHDNLHRHDAKWFETDLMIKFMNEEDTATAGGDLLLPDTA